MKNAKDAKRAERKSDERKAAAVTVAVHAGVFALLFFLVAFKIQDPPPGDMYLEIGMADFGTDLEGMGDNETENPSPEDSDNPDDAASEATPTTTAPDKVTQNESTVNVPKGKKIEKPKDKPKEDPKPSKQLSDALNNMSNTGGGGGDGSSNQTGNQGSKDGKIDGKGVIGSDGVGFELGGRGISVRPVVTGSPDENGLVVIDVIVDSNGNVVGNPTVNDKDTMTANGKLREMALKAAKTAKFAAKPGATHQKGKIYFNFKVK